MNDTEILNWLQDNGAWVTCADEEPAERRWMVQWADGKAHGETVREAVHNAAQK